MWTALFYVNYLSYFQQWNLEHKFPSSPIDSKLGFFVLVLGYTSKFFPINKKIFGFLNVALAGLQIFPIQEKDEKLNFLNVSLVCTSRFFPIQ